MIVPIGVCNPPSVVPITLYYQNDRLDHPAPSQIPLILSWELPITLYYYRNDRPDRPLRRAWGLGARSAHLSAEGARRRQAAYLREAGGRLGALLAFVVDWASRPRAAASVQGRRPRPRSGCCALSRRAAPTCGCAAQPEGLQRSGGAAKQAAKLRQGCRTPKAWARAKRGKNIFAKECNLLPRCMPNR
jgi:hypothetical protein